MTAELDHEIRQRAHGIWEQEGRPAGRAEAHWAMASAELTAKPSARKRTTRPAADRRHRGRGDGVEGRGAEAPEGAGQARLSLPGRPRLRAACRPTGRTAGDGQGAPASDRAKNSVPATGVG